MIYKPEVTSASIVAIGAFNPAIFSPDWLEANGLIGSDDAKEMRDKPNLIITHQVTVLEAAGFVLQVDENRFNVSSKGVVTPALRDLVMGIFEVLPHSPINALGQNFDTMFKFLDEKAYHQVGDALAPKSIWGKVFDSEKFVAGLERLVIKIEEGKRFGEVKTANCTNVTISRGATSFPAINFSYNDHHDLTKDRVEGQTSAEQAASIVRSSWEESWRFSGDVFKRLIDLTLAKDV